jgi:virulence-associated protein VagC
MHMKSAAAKPAKKTKPARSDARLTAKVFKSGNSTAVRIPSSLKLKAKSYIIESNGWGSFTLTDPAENARRLAALRELRGSAPDFPDHTT